MPAHDPVKSGNIGEERFVTLSGLANLDDVDSGAANLRHVTGQTATLDMEVADSANLIMKIKFGTLVTDFLPAGPTPGVWEMEYVINLNNPTRTLTWPNEHYDTVRVYEALG
jgi:hypothetical protein